MSSNKQRRAELAGKRQAKLQRHAAEQEAKRVEEERVALAQARAIGVPVNREALRPHNSYGEPDFVLRGFYSDVPFACVDCGKAETWTAHQQKWWYEVAQGDVFTTARRCRNCRRRERERKNEARRVHQEGLGRKQT